MGKVKDSLPGLVKIDGGAWGKATADALDSLVNGKFMEQLQWLTDSEAFKNLSAQFDVLAEAGKAVGRGFVGTAKAFPAFFKSFGESLSPEAMKHINEVLTLMNDTINRTLGGLTTHFESVAGWFKSLNFDLTDFGKNAGQLAAAGVNAIMDSFKGVNLYDIGKKAIDTLLDGIRAAFGEVEAAVRGFADRISAMLHLNGSVTVDTNTTSGEAAGGTPGGMKDVPKDLPPPEPPLNPAVMNKAAGGAVRRGLTYNINERGRETVTMGTNGYVTPAHRLQAVAARSSARSTSMAQAPTR